MGGKRTFLSFRHQRLLHLATIEALVTNMDPLPLPD